MIREIGPRESVERLVPRPHSSGLRFLLATAWGAPAAAMPETPLDLTSVNNSSGKRSSRKKEGQVSTRRLTYAAHTYLHPMDSLQAQVRNENVEY